MDQSASAQRDERLETIGLDQRQADLVCDRRPTFVWNAAADHRLDQLVDLAREMRVERSELAAALIFACDADSETLSNLILDWRRTDVRDVILDVPADADEVEVPRPGPGRRAKRRR